MVMGSNVHAVKQIMAYLLASLLLMINLEINLPDVKIVFGLETLPQELITLDICLYIDL